MSQPESTQNEPSKMKKLLNGGTDESPMAKLQRSVGTGSLSKKEPAPSPSKEPAPIPSVENPNHDHVENSNPAPVVSRTRARTGKSRFTSAEWKFLPAFWTIASVMSFTVNLVLLIVVIILLQNMNTVGVTVTGISDQLLGGLYDNFVKMDNATIRTQIPVNTNVPLSISVPVRTTTQITLAEAAVIRNAHVVINTGTVNINADATVTLPANTPLVVNLDFALPVQDTIPVSLLVDVNIPLRDTELSDPFKGLQDVVRPYYCLIKPDALSIADNSPVCP